MIDKNKFTHFAKFYGIPCYWNTSNHDICGRNKFYDLLLAAAIWIDVRFPLNENGFVIEITGKIS